MVHEGLMGSRVEERGEENVFCVRSKHEMRRCSNLLSTPSHTWPYLAEDNTSRHLMQTTRLVYGHSRTQRPSAQDME
ncbi:hypothetical protein WA026_005035, partial [Henosepilachna vigintioctopunctata]